MNRNHLTDTPSHDINTANNASAITATIKIPRKISDRNAAAGSMCCDLRVCQPLNRPASSAICISVLCALRFEIGTVKRGDGAPRFDETRGSELARFLDVSSGFS